MTYRQKFKYDPMSEYRLRGDVIVLAETTDLFETVLTETTDFFETQLYCREQLKNSRFYFNLINVEWEVFVAEHFYECEFEFVLDNVNKEVQSKLLFHLDIFA